MGLLDPWIQECVGGGRGRGCCSACVVIFGLCRWYGAVYPIRFLGMFHSVLLFGLLLPGCIFNPLSGGAGPRQLTTTSWPLPSPASESQQGHWSRSLCILNSMKSHQVAPLKGRTRVYSHQPWIHGRSISSTPHQHFALSTFLNLPNLIGIRGISDSYCNLNVSDYQ